MYVDAHNHIEQYGENLEKALKVIEDNDIHTLACSMDVETYCFAKEIAKDHPLILPSFGIHPWMAQRYVSHLDELDDWVQDSSSIGEVGLDFYWVEEKEKYPMQMRIADYFFKKAREQDKILNLHTKGAESEILDLIFKYEPKTPIVHWYSGPLDILKKLLDYGCYFTVGVDLGYSSFTEELVKIIPADRLLTETDGPNSLQWVNGEYGYPDYVMTMIKKIAVLRKIEEEELKESVRRNLFQINR